MNVWLTSISNQMQCGPILITAKPKQTKQRHRETGLFPAGGKGCVGGNFKALPSLNKGCYGDFIWEAIPVHMGKHFGDGRFLGTITSEALFQEGKMVNTSRLCLFQSQGAHNLIHEVVGRVF